MCQSGAGNRNDADQTSLDIFRERDENGLFLESPQLLAKNSSVEDVDKLELAQIGSDKGRLQAPHDGASRRRVGVRNVEGKQEAGVCVDRQKRSSRSKAMASAPEIFMRFLPNNLF